MQTTPTIDQSQVRRAALAALKSSGAQAEVSLVRNEHRGRRPQINVTFPAELRPPTRSALLHLLAAAVQLAAESSEAWMVKIVENEHGGRVYLDLIYEYAGEVDLGLACLRSVITAPSA